MKTIFFPGDNQIVFKDVPTPKPSFGQVLVRMKVAGICGSDLHGLYSVSSELKRKMIEAMGGRETIPGHEPCGIVEELGEGVRHLKVGDRVMVMFVKGCGHCIMCRKGWEEDCIGPANERGAYGFSLDGCFAEYMVADDMCCVSLPDHMSYIEGAMTACGFGTAYEAIMRLGVNPEDDVAVIGLGPVGLGGAAISKALGARVIGVDIVEERLKLAKTVAGVDETIDAAKENTVERIMQYTKGKGVEVAIDFSGSPSGRNNALDSAAYWGRVGFVGERNETTINPSRQLLRKQLTVIGSHIYSVVSMMKIPLFLRRHNIMLERMVTHRYPFDKAKEAFDTFATGKTGKCVFIFE
jgi:threonine dehydrogenase-like Zn-dependent dehydrogenase